MSESTPGQPDPGLSEPRLEPPTPGDRTPATAHGLPGWLPYFLLAVVPALVVGIIVFAVSGGGGGGGNDQAAAIVDGLFRSGGGDLESFNHELPPGLPSELPAYPGAKVVVSFLVRSNQGASYFVIYSTNDSPDKVLSYYQKQLDADPWQLESSVASQELNGLSFSRPDDADVEGTVRVSKSTFGGTTAIYLSFDDVSPSGLGPAPDKKFELPVSLGLPGAFPSDVPIYQGKEKSTVTAVQFQRGAGSTLFLITFLTRNSDVDVIDFYRKEFQGRGWTVSDGQPLSSRDFSISIDFQDGASKGLNGTVRADAFQDDATFTKVDLQLEVSARRGRGN